MVSKRGKCENFCLGLRIPGQFRTTHSDHLPLPPGLELGEVENRRLERGLLREGRKREWEEWELASETRVLAGKTIVLPGLITDKRVRVSVQGVGGVLVQVSERK